MGQVLMGSGQKTKVGSYLVITSARRRTAIGRLFETVVRLLTQGKTREETSPSLRIH